MFFEAGLPGPYDHALAQEAAQTPPLECFRSIAERLTPREVLRESGQPTWSAQVRALDIMGADLPAGLYSSI
jgi:hypothetical protein